MFNREKCENNCGERTAICRSRSARAHACLSAQLQAGESIPPTSADVFPFVQVTALLRPHQCLPFPRRSSPPHFVKGGQFRFKWHFSRCTANVTGIIAPVSAVSPVHAVRSAHSRCSGDDEAGSPTCKRMPTRHLIALRLQPWASSAGPAPARARSRASTSVHHAGSLPFRRDTCILRTRSDHRAGCAT